MTFDTWWSELADDAAACITAACTLEVWAVKPGNVSPGRPFDDLTAGDFVRSAIAIAEPLACAASIGVGRAILEAASAMQQVADTNTHLGSILLLAPLAAASSPVSPSSVARVLARLTPEDSAFVFEAIRRIQPGGLGRAARYDVAGEPPESLLDAMREASPRDLVARQYVNGFADVFSSIVPRLQGEARGILGRIVRTHVELLAEFGDSLVQRKCGDEVSDELRRRAGHVCAEWDVSGPLPSSLRELDRWLRADGHRRNPGTTADLITAGLFVVLRNRLLGSSR